MLNPIRNDAAEYTLIAYNLVKHGAFSTDITPPVTSKPSYRDPGYPLFLVPIINISISKTHFFYTTVLIQSFIGALTVVASYFLAKFFMTTMRSVAVSLLALLSPHLIIMCNYILTETLFTFLLLVALLCFFYFLKRKSVWLLVGSGLFIGFAIIVRSVLELFPLILACLLFYTFRNDRKNAIKYCIILLTTSFIFFAPWKIWSYYSFKDAAPLPSLLKLTFYSGSYDGFIYKDLPPEKPGYGIGLVSRDDPNFNYVVEEGYSTIFTEITKRFKENPINYSLWWLTGKPAMFWRWEMFVENINVYPVEYTWYDHNGIMNFTKNFMRFLHPLLLFMMHLGVVIYIVRYKNNSEPQNIMMITLLVLPFYFTSIHTILAPDPRYSIPLRPLMYLLAMFGMAKGVEMIGLLTSKIKKA
jgi:4-amino-4-deoxy-L-arabinose transferase-like glycosyltransferase